MMMICSEFFVLKPGRNTCNHFKYNLQTTGPIFDLDSLHMLIVSEGQGLAPAVCLATHTA